MEIKQYACYREDDRPNGWDNQLGDAASGNPTLTSNPGSHHHITGNDGWQWYLFASVDGH